MNYNENLIRNGANLIAKFEGFCPNVYKCPAGFNTVGYGHRLLPDEHYQSITKQQAVDLLVKDYKSAIDCVHRVCPRIFGCELYSLGCLVFNVGSSCLQPDKNLGREIRVLDKWYGSGSSSEKQALQNIAYWMKKYIYANKVKLTGLVFRREAEVNFLKGQLEYYCPKNTQQTIYEFI